MNRVDRLLGYLLIFQGRHLVRAQDLAARFEISERTVYRDIEALYEVGVPLVGLPGEGYQLMPGYYLPPIMFGEAEAKALFLSIALLTAFTEPGPTHNAAQVALEKIRAVLPKTTLAQVEALQTILGFYNMGRPPLNLDDQTFLRLQQAIQERRVVILQYHAQHDNQITERAVEPLQLAYLDDVWVVTAYCRLRQDQRVFRLDRIDRLQVTQEHFVARPVQDRRQATEWREVLIQVDASIVRWVQEAQHFTFVGEESAPNGALHMRYRVHAFGQIVGWLLSWGEGVEVLAPVELRQEMGRRAQAMAQRVILDLFHLVRSKIMRSLVLLLCFLTACTMPSLPPKPVARPPLPDLQPAIDGGLAFLRSQYKADYGLLQESPNIGQHRYYLTNDNALAAYVFDLYGDNDLAETLRANLDRYGYRANGFIEVAWGETIVWPPLHHKDVVVEQFGEGECDFLNTEEAGPLVDCVLQETHTPDLGFFYDWSSFSNLHCMGAVNEYNRGNRTVAQWLYETELSTFDGHGWADEAWLRRKGVYETIGLTWCLYAGALLDQVDLRVLNQLLAQQGTHGGFHTHYRAGEAQLTDPNVETTSMALLALWTLQHGSAPAEQK